MMSDALETPLVFDPGALAGLTGHVGDAELALVMADRYRRLLPARIHRIVAALRLEDAEDAMDAVLSLKVSSGTVGAQELAALGTRIERHLRQSDLSGAHTAAEELAPAAERVALRLAAYLET